MPRESLFRDYFEPGMTDKSNEIVFNSSEKLSYHLDLPILSLRIIFFIHYKIGLPTLYYLSSYLVNVINKS